MEKMSSMIVELRENCQKLQTELMECKSDAKERKISSSSSVGFEKSAKAVQTSPKQMTNNKLSTRKSEAVLGSNNSLVAGESVRKAKSVYGSRSSTAPVGTKSSASRMSSTSSNASVREETRYALHFLDDM